VESFRRSSIIEVAQDSSKWHSDNFVSYSNDEADFEEREKMPEIGGLYILVESVCGRLQREKMV
jgi:hypothetical protein